jgi:putative Holliday junction resolvase
MSSMATFWRASSSSGPSRASDAAGLFLRILGIDYGRRRIGLAVSDPTGTIASPYDTIQRRAGKRPPLRRLAELAKDLGAERLVVGLPLDLEGRETNWCAEVRAFGDALGERLGLPVDYVDERMTSVQAERAVRRLGLRKVERERKGRVDAAAAALILQAWLDRRQT